MGFTELCVQIGKVLLALLPTVLWCAFWLWAVNWKTTWKVLAQGGWVPLLLLLVMAAAAWSRVAPASISFLDLFLIPSFWWQLGVVLLWTGLAMFCGWLQGYLHLTPYQVEIEPQPAAHGHGGDHGHGHG
jgi:hypothetical protein